MCSLLPVSWNFTRVPSLRPIQFLCIVLTRSGHFSVSMSRRSSSAYAVILRNHCSRSRTSTSEGVLWEDALQHLPATTCSLANTVSQDGHQFTGAFFLYASPFSYIFRNSHWFHL